MNTVINDTVNFSESEPLKKSMMWKTDVVAYDSGIEQRNQLMTKPRRSWNLNWSILDKTARDALIKLFHRARGQYASFLYRDADDYECALAECSSNPYDTTHFQLKKRYYYTETEYWDENKKDIQPGSTFQPIIKVNGGTALVEGAGAGKFTLDDTTGIVTFGTPVLVTDTVTANFRYYFRVRFGSDINEDVMQYPQVWQYGDVPLIEVL